MIAEENLSMEEYPNFSVSNKNINLLIIKLMKQTTPNFKSYLISDFYTKSNLNEDDFTQIYIEQAQLLIRKNDYPFNVNGQYRDITNLSKGFSDFYFFPNEQGVSTASMFSVESKRLPSPRKSREKEYVIGTNNNGGLERYKTEKHGKGLYECGMLGFIEKEDSKHWLIMVNNWIAELSILDKSWYESEILYEFESEIDFSYYKSITQRKFDAINMHHIWINLP